jgi:hypothetical protein
MLPSLSARPFCMRVITFFAVAFLLNASASAAPPASRFGGGMSVYFQYADMAGDYGRLHGLAWGLGGLLHFNLTNHFRLGGMGSTYRLGYESPGLAGSYLDMGYGGLTAEFCLPVPIGRFALGIMAGGGRITNLHVLSRTPGDSVAAHYESHAAMLASPILSYEHSLTRAMSLLIRLDYPVAMHNGNATTFGSPGLRIGIVFNK